MLVNVTDVFTSDGKVLEKTFPAKLSEIKREGVSFRVKESSPVRLKKSAGGGEGAADCASSM